MNFSDNHTRSGALKYMPKMHIYQHKAPKVLANNLFKLWSDLELAGHLM